MSKKIKFLVILALSILISATIAQALVNFPEFVVFPMNYDEKIPDTLVDKLLDINRLSFVELAQHGYMHKRNESLLQVLYGFNLLENEYGFDISFFVPPYEDPPEYPLPADLFYIPMKTEGIYYEKERMDYGACSFDNKMTMSIHIQDPITPEWLAMISEGRQIDYLRVDDINTDIVDVDLQINRIYTLITFCGKNNCTLVLGIIPVVPRLYESDKSYLFFNKSMIALGMMLLLPIYLFYFLSYYLRRWLK
ncbi:MAG: hypothetical protein JW700_03225 [Candidatus Aenigmarchaeota archaeon]|nr:hypothetical protein [Candidatus Aenigmarchaeota archaeon]